MWYRDVLKYWSRKEAFPVLGTAVLGATLLAIGSAFAPLWVIVLGAVTLLAGSGIAFWNGIRLTRLLGERGVSAVRLERVIAAMKEGVLIYAPDFEVREINDAACAVLGVGRDVVGKKITPSLAEHRTYGLLAQVVYPSLAPLTEQISEEGWPHIVRVETKDPRRVFLTITDRILNDEGAVSGFLKIIQDETGAEEAEASRTEFVATTAHELRTPLTGIQWAFESLHTGLGDRAELLNIVDQGSELSGRALKIINSMLDMTQITEGGVMREARPVDLAGIVEEVMREARPVAQGYGVTMSFKPQESLIVSANADRIRTVITVLVENALKYNTKDGAVTIELGAEDGMAHLIVRDTGMGISEEDQKHLFEKFYRAEGAKRVDPNGAGLGLYITKSIVTAHRGRIWAESIPGRGSAFHVTLPITHNP